MHRHNEMALQWLSPAAMLLHRDADQFCQQRLCKGADLWMSRYRGSERAAITIDNVGAIALFKFCQPPQFVENIDGKLKPLTQITSWSTPFRGDATPHCTHDYIYLFDRHLLAQNT